MAQTPFEEHVRATLPATEGQRMSLSAFCREIGISRSTFYGHFRNPPWERRGRRWTDGILISRIAVVLQDMRDHLLWLAGYNPFIALGLSRRELHLLYEVVLKIVYAVKGGHFDGDLKRLAGLPCEELQRLSKERGGSKCESS